MRKLKLEGFNNLTKTLSLNVYYITYAETAALSFVLNNSVRKPVQLLLTMAITILLVACASFSGKTPEATGSGNKAVSTFFFECEDQSSFVARTEDGHVWLFLDSVTVNLPRRPSASGAKYQSTEYLFWSNGDEARLETARYEFRTPQADVNVDERLTRYQVTEKGQKLLLELKGQQCQDTMSGETFPTRVSVTLNGRVLQGCGRALH
jgi:membrane-bound inhibitor of C-type lysozyme